MADKKKPFLTSKISARQSSQEADKKKEEADKKADSPENQAKPEGEGEGQEPIAHKATRTRSRKKKEIKYQMKSYRLTPAEDHRFAELVKDLNDEVVGSNISENQIIRGLILLGSEMPKKKILEAIRRSLLQ